MLKDGLARISSAVNGINKDTLYIQHLRNFGDTLHSTVVVRHYRKIYHSRAMLWGISERYQHEYLPLSAALNVRLLPLPHTNSGRDRAKWAEHACALGLETITPSVYPFGWNVSGTIADNVLHNAKITKLSVPKKPYLPLDISDYQYADNIQRHNGLNGKFAFLEHHSYTLSKPPHNAVWKPSKYEQLVDLVKIPVVYSGHKSDPGLRVGIDCRSCSFRQAKALIERASIVVGCGSALTMISACEGVNTRLIELNIGDGISMVVCYGKQNCLRLKTNNIQELADIINKS